MFKKVKKIMRRREQLLPGEFSCGGLVALQLGTSFLPPRLVIASRPTINPVPLRPFQSI
jgi:hypothetical protein